MLSSSQPKQLSESALRQIIKRAVEKEWLREAFHSEHERAFRNVSDEDVMYGLERTDWVLAASPDYDQNHKSWEYLIRTCDLDGIELHLKVVPNPDDGTVKVITKY
jgi:hypothetical protein